MSFDFEKEHPRVHSFLKWIGVSAVPAALILGAALFLVYSALPAAPTHPGLMIIEKRIMQVLISVALLVASLYVILSKEYDSKDKHWAYGTVGTLLGFWLKA